jgi:hypothetical protein
MPSKLILDLTEPGVNEVAAGAVVGEPFYLTNLTVVPSVMNEATMEADIMEIEPGGIPMATEEDQLAAQPTEADAMLEGMPASETGIDEGIL